MKKIQSLVLVFLVLFSSQVWAEDVEIDRLPMALGGWIDFGRAYEIDADKFTESSTTSEDVILSHTGIYFVQSATVKERLRLDIGFAGFYFFPFPQHPEQGWSSYLAAGTAVSVAAGTYTFGDLDQPWLKATIGWSPYKYNRFAKTFGEYIFRTEAYPVIVKTGEYGAINNAKASVLGGNFGFNFLDGMIRNDFIVSMSTRIPIADVSLTDVLTLNFGDVFEVGGGVSLSRVIPMFSRKTDAIFEREDGKLSHAYMTWTAEDEKWVQAVIANENQAGYPSDPNISSSVEKYRKHPLVVGESYWMGNELGAEDDIRNAYATGVDIYVQNGGVWEVDENKTNRLELSDLSIIGFQSTKLMAKFGLDVKPLLGLDDLLNPDALQLYGEVSLLGIDDHPIYYTEKIERMPIMLGFNIPTFKLLDYLTVEVEYLKNPWLNSFVAAQFFGQPLPKLLNGNDANAKPELAVTQNRTNFTKDLAVYLGTGSIDSATYTSVLTCNEAAIEKINDSAIKKNWKRDQCLDELELNYHEDDFKWSITGAKRFAPVTLMFQVANDHFSPIQGNLALRATELTNRKASWYYMFKMQVDL